MPLADTFELSLIDWAWIIFCAMGIGMAKTGLGGMGMLVVPIMANIFGAKASTGIVLPILIMADVFGVSYYHRHAEIRQLIKLVPSTIIGIFVAIYIGDIINTEQFQILLAVIIISGIVIMIWNWRRALTITPNIYVASIAGFMGGFTTMIGNAAGPVMTIYFLSMGFKKNSFIGTTAWFFLLVNIFKVPFHITIWKTITWETFLFDLMTLPMILVGVIIGIWVVKRIPERPYQIFLMISIVLAALKLFF